MDTSNTQNYIAKYVEDLHSLVSHGLQPVSHQLVEASGAGHAEAAAFIVELQRTLADHEQRLTQRLQTLGTSPTTLVQDAASAVAGVVAGIYNRMRSEAVSKSVRDDYTFISHCSVSWLMLMATARALGDHESEELAEQGYRDCARLLMRIDGLLPALVSQELRQDGFGATNVSEWAAGIVSDAWRRNQLREAA
jgi:hypothetical protein